MNSIRYLLDENVNPRLRIALLRHEPEMIVWQIGDPATPPKGTLDPVILDWCEALMVTLGNIFGNKGATKDDRPIALGQAVSNAEPVALNHLPVVTAIVQNVSFKDGPIG